jgi:hypothetical protein
MPSSLVTRKETARLVAFEIIITGDDQPIAPIR